MNAAATASRVVSLGSACMTSELLKRMQLKTESYPFDWIFSSPEMVAHCLHDDFRTFLDPAHYRVDPRETGKRCHHAFYNAMMVRPSPVFNHRDPLRIPEDHEYLARCVDRMREALDDPSPTLYVLFHPISNAPWDQPSFAGVRDALQSRSASARLLYVTHAARSGDSPATSVIHQERGAAFLRLATRGPVGHVGFKLDDDNALAESLIRSYAQEEIAAVHTGATSAQHAHEHGMA